MRFRAVPVLALVGCVAVAAAQRGKYTFGGTVVGTLDPVQDACDLLAWLPISGQLRARWEGSTTLGFARSQYRAGQWRMQGYELHRPSRHNHSFRRGHNPSHTVRSHHCRARWRVEWRDLSR